MEMYYSHLVDVNNFKMGYDMKPISLKICECGTIMERIDEPNIFPSFWCYKCNHAVYIDDLGAEHWFEPCSDDDPERLKKVE